MAKGRYPFRRTVEFLSSGKIVLKPNVKIVLLSYSHKENSKGIRNFIFKDVPQLQYKNPNVQFVTNKSEGKLSPRIDVFFDKNEHINIDVHNSKASEIFSKFEMVAAASESEIKEIVGKPPKYPARLNPSNFGKFGHIYCICEKPGQVGCPSRTSLPDANKPKWWQVRNEQNN
ncbi:28S ribosomal protein S25, mitochondrial-like [Xenia sp. Carnegie-2017]|uniref:28S ribosomal protein S25, mitochondrial-like n=1 Tax=Xenia sp. Carnegie-2017 TaxID=2897299 RepID=UPI001F043E94|nr:28S ribosomal protein S25, mitochondrial-like [Xenia sp. Carnegie-2017]